MMCISKWFVVVAAVLLMPSCASAQEMSAAGKSAQEIFQDGKVVLLLQAVRDGDVAKARLLVAQGANINASGYEGVTPLIWMLYQRDYKAMESLLNLGADPNQRMGKDGEAPVWFAAGGGQLQALSLLLDHGGDPNSLGRRETALVIALEDSHKDCAELLLRHGADINWHLDFNSAIDAPLVNGRFDQVIWLLVHGYTYDLVTARRAVAHLVPSKDQVTWKVRALEALDKRIADLASGAK